MDENHILSWQHPDPLHLVYILFMTVLAGNAVEAHLAEGALVRPSVGVRVLVLGERELCRESPRAMRALERLVFVLCVNADGVMAELGLGREGLGAYLAHERLVVQVDDANVLLQRGLVVVDFGTLLAGELDLLCVESDMLIQTLKRRRVQRIKSFDFFLASAKLNSPTSLTNDLAQYSHLKGFFSSSAM